MLTLALIGLAVFVLLDLILGLCLGSMIVVWYVLPWALLISALMLGHTHPYVAVTLFGIGVIIVNKFHAKEDKKAHS